MMSSDVNVIWKKGDGDMPEKAKRIVDAAQGELLLRTLQLPEDVVEEIRYKADKNSQSVNAYISGIVMERVKSA
jgi:predicted HicB family RNase H-like nuclease